MHSASVASGNGIPGDRNHGKSDHPGRNVTFIEVEEIRRYNAVHGQDIAPPVFGRNIVTEGVRLNDLVGKVFQIGPATFRGVELCEPCATLGGYLATDTISSAAAVKALVHRAGLRADVVAGGAIEPGMSFELVPEA